MQIFTQSRGKQSMARMLAYEIKIIRQHDFFISSAGMIFEYFLRKLAMTSDASIRRGRRTLRSIGAQYDYRK